MVNIRTLPLYHLFLDLIRNKIGHMESCNAAYGNNAKCNSSDSVCLVLENEKVGDGTISTLLTSLQKQDEAFLKNIVENQIGSEFNRCKFHNLIVATAEQVLRERG